MSLVALFTRRLPPPCWLRAYQTSSTRLCNPKTHAAAPTAPVEESKEPVTVSNSVESDKTIKEDNVVLQSAGPSEPAKSIESLEPAAEPAKSTPKDVKPEPPTPIAAVAPPRPETKEPAPEQSKGPVVVPPTPLVPSPSILSAITGLRHSPAPALGLGLAGLIPFVAAPAYMVLIRYEVHFQVIMIFFSTMLVSSYPPLLLLNSLMAPPFYLSWAGYYIHKTCPSTDLICTITCSRHDSFL